MCTILRYCWFLRLDGGNKVWKCKLCNEEFTGSNVLVATHFWAKMSSQSLKKCSSSPLPPALIEQLETAWTVKKDADEKSAKRARTVDLVQNRSASVSALLSAQARPLADAAILEFLVMQGISVCVVNSPEFLKMVRSIRDERSRSCIVGLNHTHFEYKRYIYFFHVFSCWVTLSIGFR